MRPKSSPWLELEKLNRPKRYRYLLPKRAAAIWWMYNESAKGAGDLEIMQMMPRRFQSWTATRDLNSIKRFLKNPRVKGIQGVFSRIVTPRLFRQVQDARAGRPGGRKGKREFNLFVELAKCEACELDMKFEGEFLYCKNKNCDAYRKRWRYRDFEKWVEQVVDEFDRDALLRDQQTDDIKTIDVEIEFWQMRKRKKQAKSNELIRQIELIKGEIADAEEEIGSLKTERDKLESMLARAEPEESAEFGRTSGKNERTRQNMRLAAHIRQYICDVLTAPAGTSPRLNERVERANRLKFTPPKEKAIFIEGIKKLQNRPLFIVRYKDRRELLGIPEMEEAGVVDWWLNEPDDSGGRSMMSRPSRKNDSRTMPPARPISVDPRSPDEIPEKGHFKFEG
jgi:hypothetical protein